MTRAVVRQRIATTPARQAKRLPEPRPYTAVPIVASGRLRCTGNSRINAKSFQPKAATGPAPIHIRSGSIGPRAAKFAASIGQFAGASVCLRHPFSGQRIDLLARCEDSMAHRGTAVGGCFLLVLSVSHIHRARRAAYYRAAISRHQTLLANVFTRSRCNVAGFIQGACVP